MGARRRELVPFWALALALACAQHPGWAQNASQEHSLEGSPGLAPSQQQSGGPILGVTIVPPLRTVPVVRALNPAHNGRVCSTWGNFHYKTFDGAVFRFPGICNYVFSAHCRATYEDFNVQIRRGPGPNTTALSRVTMKLDGLVLELTQSSVAVNGHLVRLPFSQSGVLIEQSSVLVKVVAKLGLVFMWNRDGSLLLELDAKYSNQTCGLCGDFNGLPDLDEFLAHGVRLTPTEFGNLQKMDGPTEQCPDALPMPPSNCSAPSTLCEEILGSPLFLGCGALVDAGSYLDTCKQDLCLCAHADPAECLCHTLAEYSRQCAHAGGLPPDWRTPDLCPQTCPPSMQHRECGSPCADTCSNLEHSQLCEEHCVAGCFCPEGTVLDDIGQGGCVPVSQCPCMYNGVAYAPGDVHATDCANCTCSGGRWSCREAPCPGTCSVLGGAHISTFDEKQYSVHGDCIYVLAKPCDSSAFTVLAELRRCGLTDSETCLKSVTLNLGGGETVIVIKASGEVFVNQIYTQLPISAANVTVFRPSTFFIIAQTHLGLQLDVQLVPTMQVFVRLEPTLRGLTCGLCGNFNQNQADDLRTLSGLVEGTAAAFANTWKTQASCPNAKSSFEDPCSLSVDNEKYAQHWCFRLSDPTGPFAPCHAAVNPGPYYSNCLFDTCNCERSEDCLCAVLSAYVRACAARGVLLRGWRDGVCMKPVTSCPKSLTYREHITTCQPTCRSLSEEDVTCHISFVPVDGCTCAEGTFLDEWGKCVPASSCPCYYRGSVVPNGETLHDSGAVCTCTHGMLTCIGGHAPEPVCADPMVYVDCRNATSGAAGAGCQKSCHTLDMACYSPQCVPGCVCPDGLVSDSKGGCIAAADCPCVHNEASYEAGQTIRVGCNTCTCKSRMWLCTDEPCLATCAVYGDGHYLTFDGQRYSFSGDCEYTLVQDHCSGSGSPQDAFRVVTENVPCGTTGTTCSKAIKIFLGSYELKLSDGKVEVVEKGAGQQAPYTLRQMGIYLVVDTDAGLVLLWDKKTSIFIKLSPEFKGKVCGLCGNFDDNAANDFTTRSRSVVGDALEFGNSWKFSPTCPDAHTPRDPCTANPYRRSWAQKQCSLIHSATFAACHAHVEPTMYYEACVSDACACDSGGDCECFCTAVAAYAQACRDVGVCVSWRTPDVCPLFCDFYNPEGKCEWHYQPCGAPCQKTCRNPSGKCFHDVHGLEGCYAKCPPELPIFDEDEMQCVAECPPSPSPPPCHVQGKHYRPGASVPSAKNCQSCVCTESGVQCIYDTKACICTYDGQQFHPGDTIYHTTDGTGGCISARCAANGTIERRVSACDLTTPAPPTTFSFSTPPVVQSSTSPPHVGPLKSTPHTHLPSKTPSVTASSPLTSTSHDCEQVCVWSPWLDASHPGRGIDSGDFDTLENLRAHGYRVCRAPRAVDCRAEDAPNVPLHALGQQVECNTAVGLVCYNRDQVSGLCDNYQIRILCCTPETCSTISGSSMPSTVPTKTGPTSFSTGTSTPVPGTSTSVPGSSTPVLGYSTSVPGTSTPVPGTSMPVPGTSTPIPGSLTPVSGTSMPVPGSPTPVPLTSTPVPGSTTPVPSTSTPVPNTSTPVPGSLTTVSSTLTPVPVTSTSIPGSSTLVKTTLSTPSPRPVLTTVTTTSVSSTTSGTWTHTHELSSSTPTPISCLKEVCTWTKWIDGSYPASGIDGGDFDTFHNLRSKGYKFCDSPKNVECRAARFPDTPLAELEQNVICSKTEGLLCLNKDQLPPICYNYEIRILCCELVDTCRGGTTHHPSTTTSASSNMTSSLTTTTTPSTTTTVHTTTITGPATITHIRSTTTHGPRTTTTGPANNSGPYHTTSSPSTTTIYVPKTSATTVPGPKSSATVTTTSLPRTSISVPAPGTTHTHSVTPHCELQCSWTKWFDVHFPSPEPHDGDVETYSNIVRKGETICHRSEVITKLECRAEKHPDVSIDQLGQVVECNPDVGLVCRNKDQVGMKRCLNYEVRVRCCKPKKGCPLNAVTIPSIQTETVTTRTPSTTSGPATSTSGPSTTTTGPVTTPTGLATTTSGPATTTSGPVTGTTTSLPGTSISVPAPGTTHTHSVTPHCELQCSWTKWFDVHFPSPEPHDGDVETYSNIVRKGETICHRSEVITKLECRAENHPDVSIDQLGQVVECNPDVGLVCRNKDQVGMKRCLNYEVRVRCCKPKKGCPLNAVTIPSIQTETVTARTPSTTSGPATSTSGPSTTTHGPSTTTTGPVTTPTGLATTTSGPATTTSGPVTGTTTSLPGTSISVPAPGTTHTHSVTPHCELQCSWTKWFDVHFPSPEPHDGDVETYSNIIRKGETICHRSEVITKLECRAENHPDVSIDQLGQVVECNPDVGLVCRNKDQVGMKRCLNYEVRVRCCKPKKGCPLNAVTIPSIQTETVTARTPSTTSGPATSTSGPSTTTHGPSTTTTGPVTTPTGLATTTSGPATTTSGPVTGTTTSLPGTSISVPAPGTTHTHSVTPHCELQCSWTKWFDVHFPSPEPHDGDVETYSNIIRKGETICHRSEVITKLECRAENHPDVSIDQLGQVVECNPDVGLVCRNKDQVGMKRCLNYEVRVRCCKPKKGCPLNAVTIPSIQTETVTARTPSTTSGPATSTSGPSTTTTGPVTTPTGLATTTSGPATTTSGPVTGTTTSLPGTSISVPAPGTTHTHSVTPHCELQCSWTKWFDVHFPSPEPHDGDVETYSNIVRKGETICHRSEVITKLECRAENHPDVSIDQLGQVVECNPDVGLVCRNKDQVGMKRCLNYEVRVRCCKPKKGCPLNAVTIPSIQTETVTARTPSTTSGPATSTSGPSTTTTGPVTTPTGLATTTSGPATTTSGPVTGTTTSLPGTSISVPAPGTTHTHSVTPHCELQCSWTKWFDVHFPSPEPHDGDVETYSNIVRKGETICHRSEVITKLECRAEKHPDVSIDQLGQVVECNPDVGLVCRNKDQVGMKRCLNYEVRVRCCKPKKGCPLNAVTIPSIQTETVTTRTPSTTSGPATSTSGPSTTTTGPVTTPTGLATTTSGPATTTSGPVTGTTTSLPGTSISVPAPGTTHTHSVTPHCELQCSWTKWFDVHFPSPEPHDGDVETYSNIVRKGETICHRSEVITKLECRAENHPDVSIDQLGQVVECNPDVGLVCRNKDQVGMKRCLNYEVRVRCCKPKKGCPLNAVTIPSIQTETVTARTSSTTSGPATSTSGPSTTTHGPSTTTTGPVTTPTGLATTTSGPATTTSGPVTGTTTSLPGTSISVPAPGMTHTHSVTPHCELQCSWTKWFDVHFPSPEPHDGDVETYSNIIRKGETICHRSEVITKLECRAENHPDVSIDQLGQVVECNPDVGLVCRNKDQVGMKRCLNYEVRVRCCKPKKGCPLNAVTIPSIQTETVTARTPSTTSGPATSTSGPSTTTTGPVTTPTGLATTTSGPATTTSGPVTGTTTSLPGTSISVPAPGTTHTHSVTPHCELQCSWTKWFDVHFPSPEPHDGDVETYSNIVRKGETICHRSEVITKLECRAENHPDVSIDQLGQVVECNPDVGLVCRNKDQVGMKRCLNYEVRVRCCKPKKGCPLNAVTIPSIQTETVTARTSSTTSGPATSTSGPSTTTHGPSTTTTGPVTTPTGLATTTSGPATTTSGPVTGTTTSLPGTSISVPAPGTTHTHSVTPHCELQCSWTKWFDVHFPSPEPHDGDVETYSNIIRKGETICHRSEVITKLECRAENHPDVSIDQLGQVVECNPDVGLVCRNKDQVGMKRCLNYEVRVRCCKPKKGCPLNAVTIPSIQTETVTARTPSTTSGPATSTSGPSTTTTGPVTTPTGLATTTSGPATTTSGPVTGTTTSLPGTSISVPAPGTTHTHSVTPHCELQCSWTKWFDVHFPSPEPHDGDVETYSNIVRKGETICHRSEVITKLECRAEKHPDVSIDQLGQVVECNPDVGLVCRNKDQVGMKRCLNYEVRVRCCKPKKGCPLNAVTIPSIQTETVTARTSSTTSGPATSTSGPSTTTHGPSTTTTGPVTTPTGLATTTSGPATTTSGPVTGTTTSLPGTSISVPAPGTTHTHSVTPHCELQCSWTKWFDVHFPSPEPHDGDVETYSNIVRKGETICHRSEVITKLECRAENHPDVSIDQLGQVVECNPDVGLVCRNKDQVGMKRCLNYEVRVRCCKPKKGCPLNAVTIPSIQTETVTARTPSTTSGPATSTSGPSTTTTGPVTTPTGLATTTSGPATTTSGPVTGTTTSLPGTSISVPAPGTTHTHSVTPHCELQCSWTKWFDVHFPSPEPHDGDVETYSNIVRKGETICHRSEVITKLECRAENHPDVSIDQLGQVVECNPDVGLVCRNKDQVGMKRCLNYEVRVRCCKPKKGCPLNAVTIPSIQTETVTARTSSTTSGPATSTSGPSTTTHGPSTTTTGPVTTPTGLATTTSGPATTTSGPVTGTTTSLPGTSISVPAPGTTHTHSVTPHCELQCSWTKWFDVHFPSPEPHDGDVETYSNIVRKGETICHRSEVITKLECRAEKHPDVSIDQLGQVVECNPDVGLVCRNKDQVGMKRCLNYEVRVRCCKPQKGCPLTAVTIPSIQTESVTAQTPSTTSGPATSTSGPSTTTTGPVTTPTGLATTTSGPATTTSGPVTGTTTSLPGTSISVPAPGTTHTHSVTPHCELQCSWTKWFDVHFPSPEPHDGDVETYSNIVRKGETICHRSEVITKLECRAEKHPDVSIDQLGQVVECNPDVGLVCRNKDQVGMKRCLNYEVRVRCCKPKKGCPLNAVTIPSIQTETVTARTPSTTSGPATSTSGPSTTTHGPSTTTTGPVTTPTGFATTTSGPATTTSGSASTSSGPSPSTSGPSATSHGTSTTTHGPSTTSTSPVTTTSGSSSTTIYVPVTSATSVPVPKTSIPVTITSIPGTSISVPAAGTTHSPSVTPCGLQCSWTKWFDVDFPSPAPYDGDIETFNNIIRKGETICHRPEAITKLECRAVNHPEISIDQVGQVVECNPDVGLVCRNQDQVGTKRCLNYEVRVLCCEPREDCPLTPETTPLTIPSSSSPQESTAISTVKSTSVCHCSLSGRLYPAGTIIYRQRDLTGHCYYAVCNHDCQVIRKAGEDCPPTRPPLTTATPPPSSPVSSSHTPVPSGCPDAVPPRTKGETWAMPNCTQATCQGHNVVTLSPRKCSPEKKPTCANRYPPKLVTDEDGCCSHYQCQCVCSGWGDPHYITFDGTYYTFLDNCTYVLVQQIVPVYGHFRVLIDNYFCDSEDGLSCPQSIIVEYHQDRVVLTRRLVGGVMTNQIIFDNKVVRPGFRKDGIITSQIGIDMYVTIPEIGLQVMFSGLLFSVKLPFSKFNNNTEGQCGTCTNDRKDECRLPGGAVATSCSAMAGHWKVPGQSFCPTPSPPVPTTSPTPCSPSPICQLILSEVFAPCHSVIPPEPYFEGCTFDHCHMPGPQTVCSGLELYASLCASNGVCIDWRGWANDSCPFTCPAGKEYQPCGPVNLYYCYGNESISLQVLEEAGPITEGCFCPQGTMLFSSSVDVCVPSDCPSCLGPNGEMVEPGHIISTECQECTCDATTRTLACWTSACPLPPACDGQGLILQATPPQPGECCPQYSCACNTSYCPNLEDACPKGSHLTLTPKAGSCCPSYMCSPGCIINSTFYQPGAVIFSDPCETCRCEADGSALSDTSMVMCEIQICDRRCPAGFEHRVQDGQCCGSCVQVACVLETPDGSTRLLAPGESWSGDRCVTYECEKHKDELSVVTTKKACPALRCRRDQAQLSEDGCCLFCPPQNQSTCTVYYKHEIIRQQDCSSAGPVPLAYCQGNCGDTSSMLSPKTGTMEHKCVCCQELRTVPRTVTLHCANGSRRAFSYPLVQECGCLGLQCPLPGPATPGQGSRGA
ncbi:mucin-5AC [Tamandua tetradactyla]|uniref:mucin-5AC n=1 Tax=Tamandua tetradactyla TaxID=48850 RepID=UPI00405471AB